MTLDEPPLLSSHVVQRSSKRCNQGPGEEQKAYRVGKKLNFCRGMKMARKEDFRLLAYYHDDPFRPTPRGRNAEWLQTSHGPGRKYGDNSMVWEKRQTATPRAKYASVPSLVYYQTGWSSKNTNERTSMLSLVASDSVAGLVNAECGQRLAVFPSLNESKHLIISTSCGSILSA